MTMTTFFSDPSVGAFLNFTTSVLDCAVPLVRERLRASPRTLLVSAQPYFILWSYKSNQNFGLAQLSCESQLNFH